MEFVLQTRTADRIARTLPLVSDRLGQLAIGLGDTMGLTRVQMQALEYVYRNGPSSITTLRRALRRAQSSISELTDRLEAKGFAVRARAPDRRKSLVKLTAAGQRWMRTRDRQQRDALLQLLSSMDRDAKQSLLHHLLELLTIMDRVPASRSESGDQLN